MRKLLKNNILSINKLHAPYIYALREREFHDNSNEHGQMLGNIIFRNRERKRKRERGETKGAGYANL